MAKEKGSKKQEKIKVGNCELDYSSLFSKLVNSIPDLVYVKDKKHKFVMVNTAWSEYMGVKIGNVLGKTDYDFFPKKDADVFKKDEESILKGGDPIIDKTETSVYSGKESTFATTKVPYHDTDGNIIGIMGISRNITKRVAELEQEKSFFDTLMDNISEDIYFKDKNSKIVRINKALAQRYGFENPEDAIGMSDADFYSAEHANQAFEDEQRIIETGEPILEFEEKATYEDKEDRWWSSSKMPWYDKHGKIIGIFGIGKDVTDKKKAEEKIRHLSFHDPLTNLYNRAFFDEEMARLDSERQLPLTVLMGDVNGLKLINDSAGHLKGDLLLTRIAKIFKESFRKEDIVSRWGGDEFIVLLPNTSAKTAVNIKNRIKKLCEAKSTDDLPLSISIGISSKTSNEQDIIEVLKEAETTMYKNKVLENKTNSDVIVKAIRKKLEKNNFSASSDDSTAMKLTRYAEYIGKRLNLSKVKLEELKLLVNVYNIGKITIMDEIMSKSKKLTRKEWEIIKRVPELGYRIALSSEALKPIAESILSHFERFNGSGYPRGIKGDEIPILSRISFLLNSYEAMSEDRPYRDKMNHKEIIEEIKRCTGTQFDPKIVELFFEVLGEKGPDEKN